MPSGTRFKIKIDMSTTEFDQENVILVTEAKSPWSVGSAKQEWPSGRRWVASDKLVCVSPFLDGDARKTQRFILVRAREGPTSSGGDVSIILHLSACTGANTSWYCGGF